MELKNYWWVLIWLFSGGLALNRFYPRKVIKASGREEIRWFWLPAVVIATPYAVWAAYRSDAFGDTPVYRKSFQSAAETLTQIPAYMNGISKDKGFYLFVSLVKCIFGDHEWIFFLLIAAIQIGILTWFFREYSGDYWFSFFLFIASTDYISWTHNGVRQFMAVVIILLATPFMLKKNYIPAVLIILLASTMHQSALIMIPLIFICQGEPWNKRTLLLMLVTIVIILYVGRFTTLLDASLQDTQYQNVVSDWQAWGDDGTNPIRVAVYSIPALLSAYGLRYIKEADDPIINLSTNMSICTMGIYLISMVTSGIFLGRLPIYASLYSYILLPWELNYYFTEDSSKAFKLLAILIYGLFFYYQMHVTFKIL